MSWVRLDDHMADHPKIVGCSVAARWLYVAALSYCARHLTDGKLPRGIRLDSLGHLSEVDAIAAITELLSVGLIVERSSAYHVHDYLDWNPSSAIVKAKRARDRARKRKDPPRGVRTDSGAPVPVPSSNPHTPNNGRDNAPSRGRPRLSKTNVPNAETFVDDAVLRFAADLGFSDSETMKAGHEFVDYWRGEGKQKKDWRATFRNRLRTLATRRGEQASGKPALFPPSDDKPKRTPEDLQRERDEARARARREREESGIE